MQFQLKKTISYFIANWHIECLNFHHFKWSHFKLYSNTDICPTLVYNVLQETGPEFSIQIQASQLLFYAIQQHKGML